MFYFCAVDAKQEILNRAAQVIMRYGIRSVTMDDLARELSISKKTLYAHFGDKRSMVQAVVASQISQDKSSCHIQQNQAQNAIDEMFRITSFVSERLKNVNVTFFYDLKTAFPKAFKAMEEYKWGFIQEIIKLNIERGVTEGLYRPDLNPNIISRIYLSNVELVFGGTDFNKMDISAGELFKEIFTLHMRGIVSENGLKMLIEHTNNVTKNS